MRPRSSIFGRERSKSLKELLVIAESIDSNGVMFDGVERLPKAKASGVSGKASCTSVALAGIDFASARSIYRGWSGVGLEKEFGR